MIGEHGSLRRGTRRWLIHHVAAVALAAASCTPVAMPAPPGPIAEPNAPSAIPGVTPDAPIIHAPGPSIPRDDILHSRFRGDPELDAEIARWAEFWTVNQPDWFVAYLSRMTEYEHLVDDALERYELPRSLRYLPIIESGYTSTAVSSASAVGLWQLWGPTAREAGMEVGSVIDERRDPALATEVAVAFLRELYGRFDSWYLALAAYNGGPNRVARLLREHASDQPLSDSLFFVIKPHLPRETREYLPRFLAAAALASDPDRFGFAEPEPRPPFAYDEVVVPDATSLDVVAWAAGVPEEDVIPLNRHVLRGVTRKGAQTVLRVPPGAGTLFSEVYPTIPPDERVSVTEHVVVSGDTMWGIARQYGIPLSTLQDANPNVRPERIRPGDRLLVPLLPGRG